MLLKLSPRTSAKIYFGEEEGVRSGISEFMVHLGRQFRAGIILP